METASSVLTNGNKNYAEIQQWDQEAGNQHRELVISIKEMVQSSLELPLSSGECCIYRIPTWLRNLNEEAYTPRVISIGPFHHGCKRLEPMEKLKLKYFQRFLQRIIGFKVEILVNAIKLNEESVHGCYAESIKLSSDDFVKLILVDGIFIIEFFYGIWFKGSNRVVRENHIQLNPISWKAIMSDLQLLENQIPFFSLEILFSLVDVPVHPSFTSLAIKVFEHIQDQEFPGNRGEQPIKHFVDLTKAFLLPSSRKLLSPHESNEAGVKFKAISCKRLPDLTRHLAGLARALFLPSSRRLVLSDESNERPSASHLYTVSQLDEAGVKFKVSSSKYLLDLKFTNGTLEIPRINLYRETEATFRNIIAFEHYFPYRSHFTDYIVLLTLLITTPKDVDLLIRQGIIINGLGSSNAVASFLNNLGMNVPYCGIDFAYRDLFEELNSFYENPKHIWMVTLKRDYFGTPWKIASTVAAVTLLLLTLVQAICSIIQVVKM